MSKDTDQSHREFSLKRRQFLANLLFGGALTLTGLQSAQAQQNPANGWTIPDLNKPDKKPQPPRPPVRGEPLVTPPPQPPPPPPTAGVPMPPGKVNTPPNPRGKVLLPPDGDVCPPKPGEMVAPPPPPEKR